MLPYWTASTSRKAVRLKIIIKDNISYAFGADKYAYAYVEFKEGKVTLKKFECPMRNHRSKISLIRQKPHLW